MTIRYIESINGDHKESEEDRNGIMSPAGASVGSVTSSLSRSRDHDEDDEELSGDLSTDLKRDESFSNKVRKGGISTNIS